MTRLALLVGLVLVATSFVASPAVADVSCRPVCLPMSDPGLSCRPMCLPLWGGEDPGHGCRPRCSD